MKNSINKEKTKINLYKLRKRYMDAYLMSDDAENDEFDSLSATEKALINSTVVSTKKILDEMPDIDLSDDSSAKRYQRRASAKAILREINKIQNYPLSIEAAEFFYFLLQSEKLKELNVITDTKMEQNISNVRRIMISRLARAISFACMHTDDIDELIDLKGKITLEMLREDPIAISVVTSNISSKIANLKQQKLRKESMKKIPCSIDALIDGIADDTLEIDDANNIIEEILDEISVEDGDNINSLNKEQIRKQYLIHMATSLMETADKYRITDPEHAIRKIQELSMGEKEYALKIVITNLIERREFVRAKELCQKFLQSEKDKKTLEFLMKLEKEIENKELGFFILNMIKKQGEDEKQNHFFEFVKNEIDAGIIKPKAISLGKSQDGKRNISLADVLEKSPNIEF